MPNPKPVAEVRIGRVKAAIWQNETEGRTRHTVTFSRLYKDGEQWKRTQSLGRNDLLVLAKVADQAHPHRYVRFRGVGALRRAGLHRSGRGTRCRQPHFHHAAGGAGPEMTSRE